MPRRKPGVAQDANRVCVVALEVAQGARGLRWREARRVSRPVDGVPPCLHAFDHSRIVGDVCARCVSAQKGSEVVGLTDAQAHVRDGSALAAEARQDRLDDRGVVKDRFVRDAALLD